MLVVDGVLMKKNTIIELCVLPDMRVHDMMAELGGQTDNPVFLDTVGNLRFVADAQYILGYRKFVKTLLSLRSRRGFVLFIDSISFLADKSMTNLQRIYNVLWMLIYENDATVVVSNHYKVVSSTNGVGLTPRLGQRWRMMVSYRVVYTYVENEAVAKVYGDELLGTDQKLSPVHKRHEQN
ncbi:KaiC domain-containing protein [Encephalitozoon cuniculi]|nr:KaiC domain-containing protein [Encephalitozoon cuniculi]